MYPSNPHPLPLHTDARWQFCDCGEPRQYDLCDVCQVLSEAAVEIENLDDKQNPVAVRVRELLNARTK